MTITRYQVAADHPALAGHFPGRPMVPGAMLLDEVLLSIARNSGLELDDCEIQSAKFLSLARPGDELEIRYELPADGVVDFEISAGTRKVVTGSLKLKVT